MMMTGYAAVKAEKRLEDRLCRVYALKVSITSIQYQVLPVISVPHLHEHLYLQPRHTDCFIKIVLSLSRLRR
jgi:hypothetical protein